MFEEAITSSSSLVSVKQNFLGNGDIGENGENGDNAVNLSFE